MTQVALTTRLWPVLERVTANLVAPPPGPRGHFSYTRFFDLGSGAIEVRRLDIDRYSFTRHVKRANEFWTLRPEFETVRQGAEWSVASPRLAMSEIEAVLQSLDQAPELAWAELPNRWHDFWWRLLLRLHERRAERFPS